MQHSGDIATSEVELNVEEIVCNASRSIVSPPISDGTVLEVEDVIDEDVRNVLDHDKKIDD